MEEDKNRKLAIMFLILAGVIFISGMVLFMINNEPSQHKTDLPCYDGRDNVIIGLSCEGYYYPLKLEIIFGTVILIVICLMLAGYFLNKD